MLLGYTNDAFTQLMRQAYDGYTTVYITNSNAYIIEDNKAVIAENCIRAKTSFLYEVEPALINGTHGELYALNNQLVYVDPSKNITRLITLKPNLNPHEVVHKLTEKAPTKPSCLIAQGFFSKLYKVFYSDPVTITIQNNIIEAESWGNRLHLETEAINLTNEKVTFKLTLKEIKFIQDYSTTFSLQRFEAITDGKMLILSQPQKRTIIKLSCK